MRGGAGCWIADGRVWKGQLSAWSPKPSHVGSEFRMDSGVSIPTTMLLKVPKSTCSFYTSNMLSCRNDVVI